MGCSHTPAPVPSIDPCLEIDAAPKPSRSETESYSARCERSVFCTVPERMEKRAAELSVFPASSEDIASERNEPSLTVPPFSIQPLMGSLMDQSTLPSCMPR